MSQPPAPRKLRVRGMILTAGVAAITIVGTYVGAAMKTEQETKKKKEVVQDVRYEDDMIASLETRRAGLMQARREWEKKAKALQARIEGNKLRTIAGVGGARSPEGSSEDSSAPSGK